jgi:hypothetical protein
VRRASVHDLEDGLQVSIQIDDRTRMSLKRQGGFPGIPPAMRDAAWQPDVLPRAYCHPPATQFRRQDPCRHHSLLILNVMDVHWGTFPMRWQRAPDFEKQLAIPAQASELECLSGMPVLELQGGR